MTGPVTEPMRWTSAHPFEGGPDTFAFTPDFRAQAEAQIAKYPAGRQAAAVKALLDLAQRQMEQETGTRWLPRAAMDHVAQCLGLPRIRVYEVATFYSMFKTRPVGRHHLQVCTTTPCWLRGSDAVLAACRRAAGNVADGEVSADGMFSVEEVECVGACVNGPVLRVGDEFYEDLTGEATEQILVALRRGERPPAGSTRRRQGSAPEGWPEVEGATLIKPFGTP